MSLFASSRALSLDGDDARRLTMLGYRAAPLDFPSTLSVFLPPVVIPLEIPHVEACLRYSYVNKGIFSDRKKRVGGGSTSVASLTHTHAHASIAYLFHFHPSLQARKKKGTDTPSCARATARVPARNFVPLGIATAPRMRRQRKRPEKKKRKATRRAIRAFPIASAWNPVPQQCIPRRKLKQPSGRRGKGIAGKRKREQGNDDGKGELLACLETVPVSNHARLPWRSRPSTTRPP